MKLRASLIWVALTFLGHGPAQSQDLPSQAMSLMERRCLQCHNESTAMSGLKMLTREQILKGGSRGPAIKPGDANGSLLFQAILQSGKLVMPPAGKLSEDETRILRTWIDQGAIWPASAKHSIQPDWWAFCKPLRPKVPGASGAHPVDAFVIGKIEGSWHRASSRSGPTDIAATCLLRFARTASNAGAGQSISQRWGTGSVGTADRFVAGVATVR